MVLDSQSLIPFEYYSNSTIIGDNGILNDQNLIRIGQHTTHTACYLQGIAGTTGTDEIVCVEPATGKLGRRAIPSDVTLSAIGATPNANGATLTGQVLNLEPASS